MSETKPRRIESLYAFIAEDDLGEGVCSFRTGDTMLPMVGANWERVESLKEIAREIAKASGKRIRLVRFASREEIEVIEP